jgi:hypothetical protein
MRRRSLKTDRKLPMTNSAQAKQCRHCAQTISAKASTCHLCGKSQHPLSSWLDKGGVIVSIAGALASIALVVLAYLQFSEARKERIGAGKALETANDASGKAQQAASEIKKILIDIADNYITSAMDNGYEGRKRDDASRHRDMLYKRDRAKKILSDAGLFTNDIEQKIAHINGLIVQDLITPISIKIDHAIFIRENQGKPPRPWEISRDISPELRARISNKWNEEITQSVIEYIQFKGLSPDDFRDEIQTLQNFITTNKFVP